MRHIFLFLIFTLFCFKNLVAQNAFYDAKRISRISGNPDSIKKVISIILTYKKDGAVRFWENYAKKYPIHIRPIKENKNLSDIQKFDTLLNDRKSLTEALVEVTDQSKLTELKAEIQIYYTEKTILESLIVNISASEIKLEEKKKIEILNTEYTAETIKDIEQLQSDLDTLKKNKAIALAKVEDSKSKIDALILGDAFNKLFEKIVGPGVAYKEFIKLTSDVKNNSEIEIVTALKNSTALKFNVPSQSEMLDAMAIYLATRVKQEVSIAFVEKLSLYINDQKILNNLFPQTLKLLNNRDAYTKPNFGSSWQIALYEDFVHLPENIILCLPEKYKDKKDYLSDGVRIGKLVHQHYSFMEAVNFFHEDTFKVKELNVANEIIYIINHELFDTSGTRYWISAQRFQEMDQKQLEWMFILLDMKYGEQLESALGPKWLVENTIPLDTFRFRIKEVKNWMTRILVQVNHFETAMKEINNESKENKKNAILTGYWKFYSELQDVILDKKFVVINAKALKAMEFTNCVLKLYSGIDTKNYPLLVDQLFKLFDLMKIEEKVNLDNIFFTKKWKAKVKQLDTTTQFALFDKVKNLNDTYLAFNSPDTLAAFFNLFDSLIRKINEPELGNLRRLFPDMEKTKGEIWIKISKNISAEGENLLIDRNIITAVNNTKKHKDVILLINKINDSYQDLVNWGKSGLAQYKDLESTLIKKDLYHDKFLKLKDDMMNKFVTKDLFSEDGNLYYGVLNRIDSRSEYQKIRTTMSFLADVMQSENSEVLSKVIESYALPPSSYKLKRFNRFSVNVDAMVGVYGGVEYINADAGTKNYRFVTGLSAPIGISFSWGRRCPLKPEQKEKLVEGEFGFINKNAKFKRMKGNNFTVMLSIVDIGAVVSYRIKGNKDGGENKDEGLPQEAKWSQFFSPGITALLGIKGLPISVGTGARFSPNLRTLSGGLQENAIRWDVGVYFDLPLLNIFYRK